MGRGLRNIMTREEKIKKVVRRKVHEFLSPSWKVVDNLLEYYNESGDLSDLEEFLDTTTQEVEEKYKDFVDPSKWLEEEKEVVRNLDPDSEGFGEANYYYFHWHFDDGWIYKIAKAYREQAHEVQFRIHKYHSRKKAASDFYLTFPVNWSMTDRTTKLSNFIHDHLDERLDERIQLRLEL